MFDRRGAGDERGLRCAILPIEQDARFEQIARAKHDTHTWPLAAFCLAFSVLVVNENVASNEDVAIQMKLSRSYCISVDSTGGIVSCLQMLLSTGTS